MPPGDATALAAAIARGFAETPDARTALSRAARATAARYTWPQVAARYFDAFGEALRRRR